ncbi:MAG TPA: lysophospholipid acyltransferase family protein [Verrucomicrobiae bacterium]|nr:lysophospholipid acyltransferase family protein [Verrucomicrobiae bacterium]
MSLLRSLLLSTPIIAVSTVILGTLSLLVSFVDGTGRTQHRIARLWGRSLLAAGFIRVRVEGLEKLEPNGVYVFVANHASLMDIPAFLACLPYQFRFFAKLGLYRIPFIGTHLRRAGHLPVDRSSARASLKSMTEGARIIAKRKVSMLLFPEGGRCPQGLREFKEGAAYIAIKAGVPVVPMALAGMREKLPMGSVHLRTGRVTLRIGEPISTAGMDIGDRVELTKRLYQEVARLLEAPSAW